LRKGPDYAERLRGVDRAVATAGPDTTILFDDETELKRFPPLRQQWWPVGQQRQTYVPWQYEDFSLYSALEICSGDTHTGAFKKGRSDDTVQFLEQFCTQTTGKMLLVWDQASWHTSKGM
jgi:hypothetical protein